MRRMAVVLMVFFYACTSNNGGTSSLSSIDSNTANEAVTAVTDDKILIQAFRQLPSIINNCSALFVNDTTNGETEYYFVTDLKGTAFIKLNNRLMELRLIKQTNIDKYTVNELYANDEVEVDLKIKQLKENSLAQWNYNGVLVVRRGNEREALNISGKLGC